MAYQLVINLVIALIWILLQNSYTAVDLLIGYAIGFFALLILRRFFANEILWKTPLGRFQASRIVPERTDYRKYRCNQNRS